jgi:beta-mannosidase
MRAIVKDERRVALDEGWSFAIDEAGGWTDPASIPASIEWRSARVPGTLAQTLLEAGATVDSLPALDSLDAWYATSFVNEAPAELRLHGLASVADVFVDGVLALRSENMFHAHRIAIGRPGRHALHIAFRAVEREIAKKSGRARWRPRMIVPAGLRHIRTTALGRLPGFAPPTPPVGPWRAVEIVEQGALQSIDSRLRASIEDGVPTLRVALEFAQAPTGAGTLFCAGTEAAFDAVSERRLEAVLRLPDAKLWHPHTHGEPRLYAVEARIGDHRIDLGRTGFRDVRVERGADGRDFALVVNGVPTFCRGACWTAADAVSMQSARADCEPLLRAMRDAGMNMVRVPGVMLYESEDFYDLCDELGIMIWQDFAFANFDYPIQDEAFRASVVREAAQFLARVQASPALAVLSGGSEVYQQASMLGLGEAKWRSPLFDEILPRIAREHRPDVVYVENSPSGGALPFHADSGVSHYYGVGAYRRGLDDARRANVRFASECLGFSCVPEDASLARDFGAAPLASRLYAARVPRDMGAMQTFGDVTEHYMRLFYGCDPEALRENDPPLYLDIARAAVAEAMEATIGEWRRAGSATHGAIVWFLKDLWPSPGWGVIDAHGDPKSAYYALKRACRPLSLILTDEGVNGLFVHLRNDAPHPIEGELTLSCYRDGKVAVMQARRQIAVEPHGVTVLRDTELWGAFFDTTLAYQFGPPSHDLTHARFAARDGATIDAFHFPLGRSANKATLGLAAKVECDHAGYSLVLSTESAAQSVKIEDADYRPADNWLHLAPGATRRVPLVARHAGARRPKGVVSALNGEKIGYE